MKARLNEVKKLQKIAGIIKENVNEAGAYDVRSHNAMLDTVSDEAKVQLDSVIDTIKNSDNDINSVEDIDFDNAVRSAIGDLRHEDPSPKSYNLYVNFVVAYIAKGLGNSVSIRDLKNKVKQAVPSL